MRPLSGNEIGAAKVERAFNLSGRRVLRGASTQNGQITLDEIRAMPPANRNALVENRFISVWPIGMMAPGQAIVEPVPHANGAPVIPPPQMERHSFSVGFGKFVVVEGHIVAKDVNKEEAKAIAAVPIEAKPAVETSTNPEPETAKQRKARLARERKAQN